MKKEQSININSQQEQLKHSSNKTEVNRAKEETKDKLWILLETPEKHDFHYLLKAQLDDNVIWQDEAKEAIIDAVISEILAFRFKKWPLWTLFFSWPTWVWKTQMVKALALALLWREDAFTKISCENLTESHDIKKLFWAPPSYVGYDEPTPLNYEMIVSHYDTAKKQWKVNQIIRNLNDFSIILFDEIEKAHPKVHQALLSLMDEARVEFANWDIARYNNCLIIFTSNIWEAEISHNSSKESIWFNPNENKEKNDTDLRNQKIKDSFSPEFLWRIDEIIEFKKISNSDARKIIDIHINKLNSQLQEYYHDYDISIHLTDNCYDYILENWLSEEKWARELIRVINKHIENKLNVVLSSYEFSAYFENYRKIQINIDFGEEIRFYVKASNWEEIEKNILLGNKEKEKQKERKEAKELWTKPLRKINTIFSEMSMYVELYYLSMDINVNFQKELRDLEKKLRSYWFTNKDLNELKNRAYIESIEDSPFVDPMNWLYIINNEEKDIFYPYSQRIILKIIEKKVAENKDKINFPYLLTETLNEVTPIIIKMLRGQELTNKQVKNLILYVRKVIYDKCKV